MALPSSGPISLNDMHVEVGGTSGTACSINDTDIRGLIGKASGAIMSFNEWYGASAFSETRTITQGWQSNFGATYLGYYTWDAANSSAGSGPAGSINNSSLTDANGTSRTIEGFYRVVASGFHGLYLSLGGTSTSGFTKLTVTLNGTVYTLNRSAASFSTGSSPTRVTWGWSTSNGGLTGNITNDMVAQMPYNNTTAQTTFTLT